MGAGGTGTGWTLAAIVGAGALAACGGRVELEPGASDAGVPAEVAPAAADGIEYATCAPADGPAFGLRVLDTPGADCVETRAPSGAFDEIEAWTPLPATHADLVITEGNGHGAACTLGPSGTMCTLAASTRLHVEPLGGGLVRGDYAMTFGDGTVRARTFTVKACAYAATCG